MVGFFFNEDVSATGIVGFIVLIFDFCLFKAIYRIETNGRSRPDLERIAPVSKSKVPVVIAKDDCSGSMP